MIRDAPPGRRFPQAGSRPLEAGKGPDKECDMPNPGSMTARSFRSPRHTTLYWESGPIDGPLMIFLHGWPGIGLMWRAQVEAFAAEGWHCIAPDMRGYGGSSAPP